MHQENATGDIVHCISKVSNLKSHFPNFKKMCNRLRFCNDLCILFCSIWASVVLWVDFLVQGELITKNRMVHKEPKLRFTNCTKRLMHHKGSMESNVKDPMI